MKAILTLATLLVVAACAPKRVNEPPILDNGDRVPDPAVAVEDTRRTSAEATTRRDELTALGLADCDGATCAALARGEVAIGMSFAQVLAATRTTESAWHRRDAGDVTVVVPSAPDYVPADAVGRIALVHLRDGRVRAYGYQEAHGVRVVSQPGDATLEGRAAAMADALLREGDDFAARGQLERALDRYDRAQVLLPGDALVEYRIATVLDKQLRPIEALVRYQLFLHRLELERIRATGEAYGQLAEAIAHARERVLILERQARE